jgi:hypothetical protein
MPDRLHFFIASVAVTTFAALMLAGFQIAAVIVGGMMMGWAARGIAERAWVRLRELRLS